MAGLFTTRERKEFSLTRWISQQCDGQTRGTLESEMLEEASNVRGESFNPNRAVIPFELLSKRDLTASGAGGGGVFVSESTAAAALHTGGSLLTRLGVPIVDVAPGTHRLPLLPTPTDGQWWPEESGGPITVDQPILGAVQAIPKTVACLATYSLAWQRDAHHGTDALGAWLMQMVARTIDRALLAGSGTAGAPLGVANTPDIQSGTVDATDTFADLVAIERDIEGAEGRNTAWVGSPASKALLRGRTLGDGSPIWSADTIDGTPAVSTPICPDGQLFAGDWASAAVYVWNGGVELSSNATGRDLFGQARVQMRIIASVDVIIGRPERFAVASVA